jgi:hypothetical protein
MGRKSAAALPVNCGMKGDVSGLPSYLMKGVGDMMATPVGLACMSRAIMGAGLGIDTITDDDTLVSGVCLPDDAVVVTSCCCPDNAAATAMELLAPPMPRRALSLAN